MQNSQEQTNSKQPRLLRWLQWLKPGATHSAFSASLLLMAGSVMSSGVLALIRQKLIAHLFGATNATDAYIGAFELPDMVYYFLIGGLASSTFVSLLSGYRERGEEAEGDRALSVILNTMILALGAAIVAAEFFAPWYVSVKFPHFDAPTAALCVSLTRILLPAQLFFFAGGVFGSKLMVQKVFFFQALTPSIYNLGIIGGALVLHSRIGVHSLAVGAVAGAFCGMFLLNVFGARREGMRWQPVLDLRHPALWQWLKLAAPLMIGQSLTTWDQWIRTYFASQGVGDITRLAFAKQLFNSPMNILGPAAGAASLPFFASLYSQGKLAEFGQAVNRAVTRLMAVSLLAAGWMIALAGPLVDVTLRGGRMDETSARTTAWFFTIFCLSLFLWTSQNLYARAFFAAGNTFTPMLSGTIVTAVSMPVYWLLFHRLGVEGLAWASNAGILLHTSALVVLLQRNRLTPVSGLEFGELGRALLASVIGWGAIAAGLHALPALQGHVQNLSAIAGASVVWLGIVLVVLKATGSRLPGQILGRFAR
ncbi:murein biosynthesis integral membrane protein MurJ [Terriglobus sp. 2YAB30_2]|uniref:murein biosynthesis integral membrane protein MurJ n=1 Tax=unclassified Terriglobus TaxID=2628988 RepID=UPI003F99DD81